MSPELIGTLSVGAALAGILGSMLTALRRDVNGLTERVARIEGVIEGVLERAAAGADRRRRRPERRLTSAVHHRK